jgi:hypothetical protein
MSHLKDTSHFQPHPTVCLKAVDGNRDPDWTIIIACSSERSLETAVEERRMNYIPGRVS